MTLMQCSSPLTSFFKIWRDSRRAGPVLTVYFNRSSATRGRCATCGTIVTSREGYEGATAESEGNAPVEWTDHVGEPQLVFSTRVLEDLMEAGVTGYKPYQLPIIRVQSPRLAQSPRPDYFVLEITGRVDINREVYDGGEGILCSGCGVWQPRQGGKVGFGDKMVIPVLDTWDGSDFVTWRNIRQGGFFCTPKVVELARIKGWTGFEFRGLVSRLPPVNLGNPDWLAEFETAAKARYPQFF